MRSIINLVFRRIVKDHELTETTTIYTNAASNNIRVLSQNELATHLAENKITAIPSRKEPYGIIVAEALCCGSPIVATNVGGIPEVLSIAKEKLDQVEKGVFDSWVKLVEPNVESIRSGIDSLLNNNGSIKDYLALVPKIRKEFSWRKRLKEFHRLLVQFS